MAKRKEGSATPETVDRGGRPAALKSQHVVLLRALVSQTPHATLDELAAELERQGSVRVCTATIRRTLRSQGIVRMRVKRSPFKAPEGTQTANKRYGYTEAHRRGSALLYSTDLTDAEWTLVADLFERPKGSRGTPARYERRDLVNACCYVLRTGCAWRLLPSSFAPWQAVYKAFVRWVEADAFERLQGRLRQQWRERMGRSAQPSAVIIDAQSNRSSP